MAVSTDIHLYPGDSGFTLLKIWEVCASAVGMPPGFPPIISESKVESREGVGASALVSVSFDQDDGFVFIWLNSCAGSNSMGVKHIHGMAHNEVVKALRSAFPEWPLVARNDHTGNWHIGEPYNTYRD